MIEFLTGYTSGVPWFDWVIDICVGVCLCTLAAGSVWFALDLLGHLDDRSFTPIGKTIKSTERVKAFDKTNTVNRSTTSHKA